MPFVKLDCGILDSTLWVEDAYTCKVFITMLAMSDAMGFCPATATGIARSANIGIDRARAAIMALESPDVDSRSQADDGRRIRRIEGGYQIINYMLYRTRGGEDERKEYMREYMREYRKLGSNRPPVNKCKQFVSNVNKSVNNLSLQANHSKDPSLRDLKDKKDLTLSLKSRDRVVHNASRVDEPCPCPHEDIIAAYHEILPMCRRVRIWSEARKTALRARWREDKDRQNLDWWRGFFTYISNSKFLTGQTEPKNGYQPFMASLEWILSPRNFVNINEGKYR